MVVEAAKPALKRMVKEDVELQQEVNVANTEVIITLRQKEVVVMVATEETDASTTE